MSTAGRASTSARHQRYTAPAMSKPRQPEHAGGVEKVGRDEGQPENPAVEQKTGKTLQELERIQFDALDRAGFDR